MRVVYLPLPLTLSLPLTLTLPLSLFSLPLVPYDVLDRILDRLEVGTVVFNVPIKIKALYGFQTGARSWLNLGVGRQRPRNSVGSFGNPHRKRAIS